MARRWSQLASDPLRGWLRRRRFQRRNARFEPYRVHKDVDGTRFEFLIGDPVGEDWYAPPRPATPEQRFLRDRLVAPGDVIFECGAHHGLFTVLMARWAGEGGRVVAFEPSVGSARILRENVALNGLRDRVRVEEAAVGATVGSLNLSAESNGIALGGPRFAAQRVACTTLDRFADLAPTLVKVDVEGFELEVLRGADRVLERTPKWAIEVHVDMMRRYGHRADDLLAFLPRDRYDLWIQPGADAEPRPLTGVRLEQLDQDQLHLYAFPRA